jgi:hypothetical protein
MIDFQGSRITDGAGLIVVRDAGLKRGEGAAKLCNQAGGGRRRVLRKSLKRKQLPSLEPFRLTNLALGGAKMADPGEKAPNNLQIGGSKVAARDMLIGNWASKPKSQ